MPDNLESFDRSQHRLASLLKTFIRLYEERRLAYCTAELDSLVGAARRAIAVMPVAVYGRLTDDPSGPQ